MTEREREREREREMKESNKIEKLDYFHPLIQNSFLTDEFLAYEACKRPGGSPVEL